ncbi:MAG: RadC family protein [bacterium]|nr:RadC family protein [bacterium]
MNNFELIKGHRRRIIAKYRVSGIKSWHDYEILEMALFYGLPRVDTKPMAKKLLSKFSTLNGVINADNQYLEEVEGIGEYACNFLHFLRDFCLKISEETLSENKESGTNNCDQYLDSSEKVFNFLKLLIGHKKEEKFVIIFLNSNNKVVGFEVLAEGTANEVFIYPRKVVERVLYYHAVAVILAHNHPTGNLEPSDFDIEFTNKIKLMLELIDVILLDHLIIHHSSFFSFTEHGLIAQYGDVSDQE